MFPGHGFEGDGRSRALSEGAQFAAEQQQSAINAMTLMHAQRQQQQQQRRQPPPNIPSHPQQGTVGAGGLMGGLGAVGGLNHMGILRGQLGHSAHGQGVSRSVAGLQPAVLGSGRSSVDDPGNGLQAMVEDDAMAVAYGVRRTAASRAAAGGAGSTAHSSMIAGAAASPGQVSDRFTPDGLASQLLARVARRGGPGSREGDLGHLLRYMQPMNGHNTDGEDGAGDGHAAAEDEHQPRQQQQLQQQQQLRVWPPVAAPRLAAAAALAPAADLHDALASLRSRQRSDTDADADANPDRRHMWGQQQQQLQSEADHRRGLAPGAGFHSSTENPAYGARDPRHAVKLLDRVTAAAGRDAALASRQDEVHVQAAAHARASSLSAMQSWPGKRASGSGLGLEQAGAPVPREQQHPAEASDHDSDVEEVPPPQHGTVRVPVGHGRNSSQLSDHSQPVVWDESVLRAAVKMWQARQAADAAAEQQDRDSQIQQEQLTQKLWMVHQERFERQQQQQQQQHLVQQQGDAEGDQAGPDRCRGSLDKTPPRKLQATQRTVLASAQPDSAPQQRPQLPAPVRWPGQPAKQPVITQGRGPVVTARPDQPRVVATKLSPQTRVLPGSGRTPPPVIRPGPGLPGPSSGPVRGSAPVALAAVGTTAAQAQTHQLQAAATPAARTAASLLTADAVVLSDVDALLTAIGGLLTRAPAYGIVSITALLGLHAKLCVRRGVALSPWVLGQSRTLAAMQASARTRGANASALAACDTKLLLLLDLGAGGLGGEASRPPRLQQIGSSRRATGGRSSSVLDTSQLGSWFVVHWWPDKEGDEVAGVGGTSGSGSCGRPQLESLHAFAARFLPQSALGRAAAEDTAKAEQAVLELISVLPYPESSGVKGLEELRGALTSGRVQERELQPLAQWWQGGPGPCSALGAAHAAATEHQHNYHEQHAQALRGSDAQQDPESSGAFAALLLLAEAAVEPNLAKGVAQEQSMSAQAATMGKEWGVQEPTRRAQGAALDTTDGSQEGGGRDVATAQHQHAEPSSQTASPQLV